VVRIEPWGKGGLPLLEQLLGDPAMMEHLGGPESPEKLAERQAGYEQPDSRQFRVVLEDTGEGVGWVGYWERAWRGEQVYEIGWSVLPAFQGRGIGGEATAQAIALARAERKHRFLHAYPSIDNAASNAICRKLGFTLLGESDFEYPPGNVLRCNDWRLDLFAGERIIRANGVDLCVESFGDPADPAILLVAGAAGSMLSWQDEFCERLAGGSQFVIRYDHRDTGRSVAYEPGAPEYTFRDLVADAVGVLDALGLDRAHVVGISMGGAIGQHLALDHPERVAALTLIATSPGRGSDLPPMTEELRGYFERATAEPDWSDRAAVIDFMVEGDRAFAARSQPFDEAAARELAARVFDRAADIASSLKNHWILEPGGEPARPRLGAVRAPTLVLHGTEDPLFPSGHGEALAREIPGARLLPLERTGHELPRRSWDVVVRAILEHTES